MTHLTTKDLETLTELLRGEELACKKAKIYASTLTDAALAECFSALAQNHERRFGTLLSLLEGGNE